MRPDIKYNLFICISNCWLLLKKDQCSTAIKKRTNNNRNSLEFIALAFFKISLLWLLLRWWLWHMNNLYFYRFWVFCGDPNIIYLNSIIQFKILNSDVEWNKFLFVGFYYRLFLASERCKYNWKIRRNWAAKFGTIHLKKYLKI